MLVRYYVGPQIIVADYIALCAGLHVTPSIPTIPGIENVLTSRNNATAEVVPKIFHSHTYKSRSQLTGRRVLILGTGETGMDLAYESVKAGAREVVLCSRSGYVITQLSLASIYLSFLL